MKKLITISGITVLSFGIYLLASAQFFITSSITCNGVNNICNVANGNKASIGWACSGGATSGQVRNDQDAIVWSGLSGLRNTDDILKDTIYFVECSGGSETNTGNVLINVVQGPITDITSPQVIIFNVSSSGGGLVTLSWDVSDSGGSFLNRIVLERSVSNPTDCNSTTQAGCNWTFVSNVSAPTDFNRWDSAIYDQPSVGNNYEYRIKVFDNAGNMTVYPIPPSPPPPVTNQYNLIFSSYLGGSQGGDQIRDVAFDNQGNMYVTGGTDSPNFPVTAGAYQTVHNPGTPESTSVQKFDIFVTKISPAGQVIWSTFIGGPNYDRAYGIELDNQGNIYIAGRAGRGFPVTSGAFQTSFQGGISAPQYGNQDGFVAKLSNDGKRLIWASYFGTNDPWIVRDLAVDSSGNVYLASARDFGTYPSGVNGTFVNSPIGLTDAVIAKVNTNGSQVLWARYVGGTSAEEHQNSVRIDPRNGDPVLLTATSSTNVATAGAYDTAYGGNGDYLISKFSGSTGALSWSTYLGGSLNESTETHEFAGIDAQGNIYVTGPTKSTDFPVITGAVQPTYGGGGNDTFISKISSNGSRLLASTYFGGNGNDRPEGTAVDSSGNVYLTGVTNSTNRVVTAGAVQSMFIGASDAFLLILDSNLKIKYSSYYGGLNTDIGRGAVADNNGNFYFAGSSDSADLILVNPYDSTPNGQTDAYFGKLALSGALPPPPPPPKHPTLTVNVSTVQAGKSVIVSWINLDAVPPSPIATDWIGLYPPGVNDFGYLSYIYAGSCISTVGAVPNVSGSCSFTIPASTPAGTYNLLLFDNIPLTNGLATTASFTVTGSSPLPSPSLPPSPSSPPPPSTSSGPTPTASAPPPVPLPPPPEPQSFDFLFEIPNPFSGQISTFDDLINAIILFLYYIAGPIIVVMIVLAGLFFLFGRGEPSKIETGKKILFYAIIGLIILLIGRGFVTLLHSIIDLGV